MVDYEKLYKETLAKAREIHRNEDEKRFDMEWLFPELKGSEDELTWLTEYIEEEAYSLSMDIRDNEDRIKLKNLKKSLAWLNRQVPTKISEEDEKIRKEIINYFECQSRDEPERKGIHNRWIAWLEKQESVGEIVERCKNSWYNEGKIDGMAEGLTEDEKYQQGWHDALEKQGSSSVKWQKNTPDNKPAINHSVLMKTVDGIAEGEWDGKYWHQYRWSTHIYDSNVLYWIELHDLDEQGEQKQKWSEEDENRFQNIIACIEDCYNEKDAQDLIRWFKSLRHQPKQVWSNADIKLLELIIDGYQNTEDFSKVDGVFVDWLKSLKCRMKGKED